MKKAIILFSGGLDSTTTLAIAKNQGYEVYALSFHYGQRHKIELERAKVAAEKIGVKQHRFINIDSGIFENSALTTNIEVPKDSILAPNDIPITYVPARNTIFLSFALAWAEVIKANNIFIGANIVDYSNYPDCRPDYISAFEKMANLGTEIGTTEHNLKIHAPLIQLSKSEIIELGLSLGVDYANTISCYDPDPEGNSCGHCYSCLIRLEAFAKLNVKDPVEYVKST